MFSSVLYSCERVVRLALLVAAIFALAEAGTIGRGLAVAALNYSLSQRFVLLGTSREKGYAAVFDTAEGAVTARSLPPELLR